MVEERLAGETCVLVMTGDKRGRMQARELRHRWTKLRRERVQLGLKFRSA